MNSSQPQFDSAISGYYAEFDEESRLQSGAFLLEGLRTRELLERHLPEAPATVLDIGGAAGAYAFWLAARGYMVHLIDPVARHIEQATLHNAGSAAPLASCTVGDARAVPFADACADAVLLLGPLYHLTAAEDRHRALTEAARVLKPGSLLFASAISRFASTLDGLVHDAFCDPAFVAIAEQDLRDGQHRNDTGRQEYFTTAYFHMPEDLRVEIQAAGFEVAWCWESKVRAASCLISRTVSPIPSGAKTCSAPRACWSRTLRSSASVRTFLPSRANRRDQNEHPL